MRYLRLTVEARAARNRHGQDPTAVLQTVASHLRHARTAMKQITTIRRDHSRAIKAIEQAGRNVTTLQDTVLQHLDLAEQALESDDVDGTGTAEAA